jgi:hypothetical protein
LLSRGAVVDEVHGPPFVSSPRCGELCAAPARHLPAFALLHLQSYRLVHPVYPFVIIRPACASH